ncbi:sulfate ABC transporter permease subunit CysW [Lyngbya confervoides]|uniref:Sulfate ABC transporter permease subunit CysW n=1 Tax=Lyngbya confervoides BDU141951 TaxID=1574623 RepID=A0ABD4T0D3_9CYAN|nr:sulfate ABC transporter permease subunit CysW [Lyngbya confervoides]MCM1982083.1 sulfate ABC transporter permease subunit CysW [Lyngbya confervoides BDU141951]
MFSDWFCSKFQSLDWKKFALVAIAVSYLACLLFVPTVALFYEAFHQGFAEFLGILSQTDFIKALQLTLLTAGIALPVNTGFGLCAAWFLARRHFLGRSLLISVLDLPFSISPVVVGLMLVLLYGDRGWLGFLPLKIIFAPPGIVLATLIVTLPFVAREVMPVLEESGPTEEESARTLGAKPWQVFWRVTLPNIRWGLLYGVLLTNARAMGEFGAVAVVSGNIVGKTQTLPLFVEETYKNYQTEAAFGASTILALLAVVTLVLKEVLERKTRHKAP